MKNSKINSLVVYLCGVLLGLWLITPMMAVTAEEGPGDIDQWLNSLPEKTRASVQEVFANVACMADNGIKGEKGAYTVDQLAERIYRDLQIILTEEQLYMFSQVTKRSGSVSEMDMSRTLAICTDCSGAYTSLSVKVVPYIEEARDRYNFDAYCEHPPYGIDNSIGLFMGLAESAAKQARDKTLAAYNSCDCTSAQDALTKAQQTLSYLNTAITGTNNKCDPNPPWLEWLEAAKDWVEHVIDTQLPDCISEACN